MLVALADPTNAARLTRIGARLATSAGGVVLLSIVDPSAGQPVEESSRERLSALELARITAFQYPVSVRSEFAYHGLERFDPKRRRRVAELIAKSARQNESRIVIVGEGAHLQLGHSIAERLRKLTDATVIEITEMKKPMLF